MEKRILNMENNFYYNYPKNIFELFLWVLFDAKRLQYLSNNLSKKESFLLVLKSYIFILFLAIIIFLILTNFNFSFLSFSYLFEITIFVLLSSLIICYMFDFKILFMYVSIFTIGLVLFLNFEFYYIYGFILGFLISYLYSIEDYYKNPLYGIVFLLIISSLSIVLFYQKIVLIIFLGFITGGLIYKIFSTIYMYVYVYMSTNYFNINLQNNPFLNIDNNFYVPNELYEKISYIIFNNTTSSKEFINFLFKFRSYHRDFVFHLLNIRYASIFYSSKLSVENIFIPKNHEKNQPTENFTNTLQILKNELEKYQIQNNIHHKIVSLKKIIEILKDLEQQMLIEKRGWSEYYLKAIRANLDEANARIKNLELEAKNREPITPNIYEIGNPLSPNYQNRLFKGRKEVVDRLSNIIYTSQQMPLLLIQGQRRVGKTSLINYLEQLLGSGFKIIKLDMQSATNKRFNSLVHSINQELNKMLGIDETIETSDDILESWIAFESYLTKHTKNLNYKIIIAFDEYESFHEYIVQKYGKIVLENMRSFIQSQNQVIFLFAGMLKLSDLTVPNWDEYFPQAQRLKVDYLSKEESFELITNPVEDFNLIYTNEVTEEVYKLTMGHPQLLQTICSIIVTIANEINQKNVTHDMVIKAKEQVLEVNDMPMTIFWREFCGDSERKVIEQILANSKITRDTSKEKRAIARLIDYGFITKEFKIRVPLFEIWLKERRDLIEI